MKKSMIMILLLVLVTTLAGCINENKSTKVIENRATGFIDEVIAMHEGDWRDYKIIDSKITKLERVVSFDNIIDSPIEVWNLEFRLKPDNITNASYKTTLYEEDGWITEDNGMGKRCLVFIIDGDNTRILGGFQHQEFDFNSLAEQEKAVRVMLANIGLLPKGAYEGNHVVIKFPLSEEENGELFLSQPVIQGDKGIWAVERWKDGLGFIHHEFPGIDASRTDIKIDERYKELQEQFNNGEDLSLGDPIEVAMWFIDSKLRQYYFRKIEVEERDFDVIDPATMEDFVDVD